MEDITVLYFYKNLSGNNCPVIYETGSRESIYSSLINGSLKERVQKDFPKTENNLFALVDGVEFKIL